jgi:hypothetical protein
VLDDLAVVDAFDLHLEGAVVYSAEPGSPAATALSLLGTLAASSVSA